MCWCVRVRPQSSAICIARAAGVWRGCYARYMPHCVLHIREQLAGQFKNSRAAGARWFSRMPESIRGRRVGPPAPPAWPACWPGTPYPLPITRRRFVNLRIIPGPLRAVRSLFAEPLSSTVWSRTTPCCRAPSGSSQPAHVLSLPPPPTPNNLITRCTPGAHLTWKALLVLKVWS